MIGVALEILFKQFQDMQDATNLGMFLLPPNSTHRTQPLDASLGPNCHFKRFMQAGLSNLAQAAGSIRYQIPEQVVAGSMPLLPTHAVSFLRKKCLCVAHFWFRFAEIRIPESGTIARPGQ